MISSSSNSFSGGLPTVEIIGLVVGLGGGFLLIILAALVVFIRLRNNGKTTKIEFGIVPSREITERQANEQSKQRTWEIDYNEILFKNQIGRQFLQTE